MNESWWLSSLRMTVQVVVKDGLIIKAAPITAKFIGQPLSNLIRWMERQGGFYARKMEAG